MILVGNKSDLEDQRVVSTAAGEELARKFGCAFIESSAKNKLNHDSIFFTLIREMDRKTPALLKEKQKKKKKSLCMIM
jgi:hypothetical protein